MERAGRGLTRQGFLDAVKNAALIDLEGFKLYYGIGIDQGSNSVFLTAINNSGRYQPITKLTDITQCVNC